jgi:prophage DNA circulation protein
MQIPDINETTFDSTVFEKYPVASWSPGNGSRKFFFSLEDIKESGGNRIVPRRRPFRDGAKLDDTGSNEKTWVLTAYFENTIDEPNLQNLEPQYPGVLNDIIDSFDVHETGTLQLPTRGEVRVRAQSYERIESSTERDCARVVFTFVQDNEDAIDAASFSNPTVRATVQTSVDATVFGMEGLGGFSQFLADLEAATLDLQDAIAAPGEALADLDQKAARVGQLAGNVEKQFLVTAQLGRDLLTDPDAWATLRELRLLQDRTNRAVFEKTSPIAPIVTAVFATARSIFDIATQLAQDPSDLAAINGDIEDLLFIPAGVVVNVFQPTGH